VGGLVSLLRAQLPNKTVVSDEDETGLAALWETGRSAFPDASLAPEVFMRQLARHIGEEPLQTFLAGLRAADFYLACACSAGDAKALKLFEERYLSLVGAFLHRMRSQPAFIDDVRQALSEKLFVGSSPKITEYSGRGELSNWLRVVSIRTALNLQRRRTELLTDGERQGTDLSSRQGDPELSYIKERYRGIFQAALEASLVALSQEQRNLLRLHFLQSVTLDALAELFRVHRATIARRIAQAREQILEQVRSQVEAQLGVDSAELASLMGLLRSRLDVSVTRLLDMC
jgi:RNA polymerase sigma-70 factor (ECF subfamily)